MHSDLNRKGFLFRDFFCFLRVEHSQHQIKSIAAMKVSIILLLAFASLCCAHLCLVEPVQRGGIDGYGTVGAPVCLMTSGTSS